MSHVRAIPTFTLVACLLAVGVFVPACSGDSPSSSSSSGGIVLDGGAPSTVADGGVVAVCVEGATEACVTNDGRNAGVGACKAGQRKCIGGAWSSCEGEVLAKAETCNGIDDDCDGQVDEGFKSVTCGKGACTVTVDECKAGVAQTCTPLAPADEEACNGLDDDCDGTVDEGCGCTDGQTQACYTGSGATRGVGECKDGMQTCAGGKWGACKNDVTPTDEACDGKDNDCDGTADEELGSLSCGKGACAKTVDACVNGTPQTCTPGAPSAETCNGLDDDCDGVVDNGNPGGAVACPTGKLGVCSAGTTSCTSGAITCNQNVQPSAETCDGLDNDCDGVPDNGNPGGGLACPTGKLGVCSAGTTSCTSGAIKCNQNVQPSAETCDGLDNDCDGTPDNGVCGCAHDKCSQGVKLVSGCDPCVLMICAVDAFCCSTSWDQNCVAEVATVCGIACN